MRGEQAVVLELLAQVGRDARTLAELVEGDRLLLAAERRRTPALPLHRPRRVELVLDHAQRQELVSLQPQALLEPFDVGRAEQPVAALCPARRQEAFVLEVPDLRDRDVRELLGQATDHLSDPEQALALLLRSRRSHAMNVIRYLPTCSSSPSRSGARSMRWRLTN